MATYEHAAEARDQLADELLDGRDVVSVGIVRADDGYGVGVTATRPMHVPNLPDELSDVHVKVRVTGGGAGVAHSRGRVARVLDWIRPG